MNKVKDSSIVTPLINKGVAYHGYGVHRRLGGIWSNKSGTWKQRKWHTSGQSRYPRVTRTIENKKSTHWHVHVAVHETLNPELPIPPGVTVQEWRRTPKSVKKTMRHIWQVNHRDHNPMNFKPNNLEWVTQRQNAEAYQKHRLKQVA